MRRWMMSLALILAALLLLTLLVLAGRLLLGALSAASGGLVAEEDPMIPPPAERVTRPPSLAGEADVAPPGVEDPSRNWRYQTLTPLDPEGYAVE